MNCYLNIDDISALTCDENLKTFVSDTTKTEYVNNLISRAEDFLHQFIGASCLNNDGCFFYPVTKEIQQATFEIFYRIYQKDPCSSASSSSAGACGYADTRSVKSRTVSDSSISVTYADDESGGIEFFIPAITRVTLQKYKNVNLRTNIGLY